MMLRPYIPLRATIGVHKQGFKYYIITTYFKDGKIDGKSIETTVFPFKVTAIIREIVSEEVLKGVRLSAIEIYNYSSLKINESIRLVKVHNYETGRA